MTATHVGFIGARAIARVHLRGLADFDDVRVVAVASRSLESAGRLAESAGARAYSDYRSTFEGPEGVSKVDGG